MTVPTGALPVSDHFDPWELHDCVAVIMRYLGGGWAPGKGDGLDFYDRSGQRVLHVGSAYLLRYMARLYYRWLQEEQPSWRF